MARRGDQYIHSVSLSVVYLILIYLLRRIISLMKSFYVSHKLYFILKHVFIKPAHKQGCQFSGNSLNSGPGELFSDHSLGFFRVQNSSLLGDFQAL